MSTAPAGILRPGIRINPNIAALPTYNAGMNVARARAISGRDDIARLGSNENPDGCSPAVLEALASAAFEPSRYADPACAQLRQALADRLGVSPGEIVVGNGSEEMIAAISRVALGPGSTALTVVPSFGLHEIEPLAVGARVRKIPMDEGMGFDIEALERALAEAPEVFFVSSPWNPVGPALDRTALARLVAAARPTTLFVLDEAYREFADTSIPDGIDYLRASGIPHVVLRTFSKAYGLAGLRVGYAVCSDAEIARVVAAAKTPFNVNAAAQVAALAALGDESWMLDSVGRINAECHRVRDALVSMGVRVSPSQTNFLFLDSGGDSAALAASLLRDGIVVKAWREAGYQRFLRATIGSRLENDRLIETMRRGRAA